MNIKGKKVIFATFSMWHRGKRMPTNGNVEPFRDYLLSKKVNELILIDQPVPSSEIVMPVVEKYRSGKKIKENIYFSWYVKIFIPLLKLFNKHGTRLVFKIRDFLSVIDLGFRNSYTFDLFVGIESINCLAGIILRKFGRVDKVVYYVLDFAPNRYSNGLLNKIYLFMDKLCAEKADFIWDVSREFQKIRLEYGINPKLQARVIHVPIGLFEYQIVKPDIGRKSNHSLVFVGTLGEENGPDLAIETVNLVIKKFPDTFLHIIGGGENNLKRLKTLAKRLDIQRNVKFYGYVESIREMVKIISKYDIGLAPYKKIPNSIRYYADSAKIRTYAGASLPVITTDVPPLGKELAGIGGAIISDDNPVDFSRNVIKIFSDKKKFNEMKKKVMIFSKNNTWNNEFDCAFDKMV